jgi:hypothetical protein
MSLSNAHCIQHTSALSFPKSIAIGSYICQRNAACVSSSLANTALYKHILQEANDTCHWGSASHTAKCWPVSHSPTQPMVANGKLKGNPYGLCHGQTI